MKKLFAIMIPLNRIIGKSFFWALIFQFGLFTFSNDSQNVSSASLANRDAWEASAWISWILSIRGLIPF